MASLRFKAARIGVALLSLLLALAVAEGAVRMLDLLAEAREEAAVLPDPEPIPQEAATAWVMHPFLGWVRRTGTYRDRYKEATGWAEANSRANLLGYHSAFEDYRDLPDEDFVIGIFGGSVAHDLAVAAGDEVARAVEEARPELAGRVRIVNAALGGHKQPQQLLGLIQMRLLEVPLDVVVNLDGFNEVALSVSGISKGHHPMLPNWGKLIRTYGGSHQAMTQEQVLATAEAVRLQRSSQAVLRWLHGHHPLARSELVRAALGAWLRAARNRERRVELRLRQAFEEGADKIVRIPDPCMAAQVEGKGSLHRRFRCLDLVVDLWLDSSTMMAQVAHHMGASYLHFLQPNQHLPGSKPLTGKEQEMADINFARWKEAVEVGYPRLQAASLEIEGRGVTFVDLTPLFKDATQTLYRDSCCHLNREGNRMLAARIGREVAATTP